MTSRQLLLTYFTIFWPGGTHSTFLSSSNRSITKEEAKCILRGNVTEDTAKTYNPLTVQLGRSRPRYCKAFL